MRKFFLIPLMTLFSCVMAFATVRTAGSLSELQSALSAAVNGDEIQLTADIIYGDLQSDCAINITKSITLNGKDNDGNIHTIQGSCWRTGNHNHWATVWVNQGGSNDIDVIFKDIKIINTTIRSEQADWAIQTRGKIKSLTLQNVYLEAKSVPLQIGGNHSGLAYTTNVTIENSHLYTPKYYCLLSWNKYNLTVNNTVFEGWNALYFKGANSSIGSQGTTVVANNCTFNCPNYNSGKTNAFGMFVFEDDGISLTLNNCAMDALQFGDQYQTIAVLSGRNDYTHRSEPVSISINGDNTYINGLLLLDNWAWGDYYGTQYPSIVPATHPLSITISGGTYNFNPEGVNTFWYKNQHLEGDEKEAEANKGRIVIPAGYEVKTIETQQGDQTTTLYRVRKTISTSESINDNVEGQGDGVNANTEFLISANETVEADATIAHYVEVSNDATLTLPAGKELTVKNGLDVTNGAVLDVKAGSTLIVGEGGVTAESVNSIVVEADENGSASFLLDPEVIVNTTPNITIKMTAKGVGYEMDEEEQDYYWFRFAAPVAGIEAVDKWVVGSDPAVGRPTYFYKWNYAANEWSSIDALSDLEPFQGFSLTTNHEGLEDIEYTFKGRLAGNQDMKLQFQSRGYNYFGNSYTGYIDVLALVDSLMDNDAIDGTVYMWDNNNQRFKDVPLGDLTMADESWKREVAPMQTFILRQVKTGVPTSTEINYASAIWGNPRYGLVSAPAPARQRVNNDVAKLTIVVTSANGKIDEITFKESNEFNDEYNKGFDAVKFMNERQINLYSTINNENLGSVATNNIEGKLISMQTVKALNYTMSFENVNTDEYAIRDNVTGAVINITEGNTYEFAAQPNSVIEGRFEIVSRANMPTAIENTEVKANVKGIYTIMGQYLGENFDILPAGVYVVDGVKIVK